MLKVHVYLFVLSGDSFLHCVEMHKDGQEEVPCSAEISTKEWTKIVEEFRKEVFAEIAFAAVKDSDLLLDAGGRIEKLQKKYSDMLPHCLEYIGVWAVDKSELENFLHESFTLDSFLVACGRAFLNRWTSYGTAWATVFEVHNGEAGEVSYRHSDIQAEI